MLRRSLGKGEREGSAGPTYERVGLLDQRHELIERSATRSGNSFAWEVASNFGGNSFARKSCRQLNVPFLLLERGLSHFFCLK